MLREISAGAVVVHKAPEGWSVAVIEPQRSAPSRRPAKRTSQKVLLALPKGLLDSGETPEQTALREVQEETGLVAAPIVKLADVKYTYVRSWGDQQKVFKIVSFYLFLYSSGEIDQISREMRIEVKRALWVPLEEAIRKLAYRGERDMVRRAQEYLTSHPELCL